VERVWFKMDWGGSSLRLLLERGFRFTGPLWFEVMRGIANGLSQPQLHKMCHGYLKPSNS
jgi:hypothetical protein